MVQVAGWVAVVVGAGSPAPVARRATQWNRLALNLCVAGVGATTLVALAPGAAGAGCRVAGVGVWVVVVSLVAASNGGINSPNLLIYPVLIVLCGWLLGSRSPWVCWRSQAVCLRFSCGLICMGLCRHAPHNRWAYAVYLAGIVGFTAAATLLSQKLPPAGA